MNLQIRTVDYDLHADKVIAAIFHDDAPFARVELTMSPNTVEISCEFLQIVDDVSGHSATMLPARAVDALYNACTADNEILYVPSESVLPLELKF